MKWKRHALKSQMVYFLNQLSTRMKDLEERVTSMNIKLDEPDEFSINKNDEGLYVTKVKRGVERMELTTRFNGTVHALQVYIPMMTKPREKDEKDE